MDELTQRERTLILRALARMSNELIMSMKGAKSQPQRDRLYEEQLEVEELIQKVNSQQ